MQSMRAGCGGRDSSDIKRNNNIGIRQSGLWMSYCSFHYNYYLIFINNLILCLTTLCPPAVTVLSAGINFQFFKT